MNTDPSQNAVGILLPASHSSPEKQPKMNPRREAFIRHYVESGNATKSAILAGYSEKSAAVAGSRLLTNPEIKGAIDAALLRQAEHSDLTATYVLEGIRANLGSILVFLAPNLGPTANPALGPCAFQSGKGALTDANAFLLGNCGQNRQHRIAEDARTVKILLGHRDENRLIESVLAR